jgi:hypothetical protein
MIKKSYFLFFLFFFSGLSSIAQAENEAIRTYIKPTKEEEDWLKDAGKLYVEFARNIADAPKHQINIQDIDDFVKNRCELGAYIQVESQNVITDIPLRRYFNILRARYSNSRLSRFDNTSEIEFRNYVVPYIAEDPKDKSHIVKCEVIIVMIDRKNGIKLASNEAAKVITITFKKDKNYRTPKIKYIEVKKL